VQPGWRSPAHIHAGRAPWHPVLDEQSGLRAAGAIVATFGITDQARMDVLSGRVAPTGKMPFALAGSRAAIENNRSDVPGYDDELFGYGHGLAY